MSKREITAINAKTNHKTSKRMFSSMFHKWRSNASNRNQALSMRNNNFGVLKAKKQINELLSLKKRNDYVENNVF